MAEPMKQYLLMHKNMPVAEIGLDTATGIIMAVTVLTHKEHIPVGVPMKKGEVDRAALNEWWRGRAIPASRAGIRETLLALQISDTQLLIEKCLGLSLSDQYWICPPGSDLTWSQVNFFENPFSDDVGNILFGKGSSNPKMSLMSPDNTSDGWLKKKWVVIDGKRCLIKGGSGATQQEPYNEVLASRMMERLGIPHVPYRLVVEDEYPYSICEDFITPDTELISAWHIMQTKKKPNHMSVYRHYLDCCDALGIPGVQEALDRMMVLDYLIVNEDRHQNNFGVIRNAETLAFLGPAPIYDSGTSLWFDKPQAMINAGGKASCKPFKTSHEEQIRLVTDFSWLDISALAGIEDEWREIVRGSLFIDAARSDALCRGLRKRVEMLREHVMNHKAGVSAAVAGNATAYDVMQNVAYSGTLGKAGGEQ